MPRKLTPVETEKLLESVVLTPVASSTVNSVVSGLSLTWYAASSYSCSRAIV